MNEHCKFCTQPKAPRKDRPGKHYTMCVAHLREYRNQKQKEFYQRNREDRIQYAREYREKNADKVAESVREYNSRPEVKERKRKYMETYLRPWREHLKPFCEKCGFEAQERRQLDVHHKDGDKSNNDPSNLITLCPPCHRLIDHSNL